MEHIYKTHLLYLFEQELSNYHREVGEHAPLIQTFELYPVPDDFITYNVLYKVYEIDKSVYYIAKIRLTHHIDVVSTKQLNEILEGLR